MNCRKLRLGLMLVVGLCLCFVLIARVEAQLNFSTGWGKRGQSLPPSDAHVGPGLFWGPQDAEMLIRLYLRMRKMEVERHANSQM